MKNRASVFLKQILSVITSLVKSKTMAIKNKTSAMKTRIIIYSLLNNKKVLMSSISHKFNSLLLRGQQLLDKKQQQQQQQQQGGEVPNHHDEDDRSKLAIVLYNNKAMSNESHPTLYELAEEEEEESHDHKYPDIMTHTLFESVDSGDEELDDEDGSCNQTTVSVIDLVRNSKEEEGENFRLEDEIDHVADLFIRRFHQQMRLQKQESFKRYQEMLQRSV